MCGINGIFNFNSQKIPDEFSLMEKMNHAIRHRGPDDSGIWHDHSNKLWLGHQRLSIIELSNSGHQPMISDNGNVIVFNGEIYNYKELKSNLKNISFRSNSDTEVLLKLYELKGENLLNDLNGMFAFAIWNSSKEELFLARDRIGKKPLYYTFQSGIFVFSSEIKALLSLPWIKAELDYDALYHFLTFNQLSPPQTMFRNIEKLAPGWQMSIGKDGKILQKEYWEVEYKDLNESTEEQIKSGLLSRFEKSVDYRMVSDVSVGAFLSGGVDSSAVVYFMSEKAKYPVNTYSIGFENLPSYDELTYAQKVSGIFKTNHHEKIVNAQDIKNFLLKIVEIFDEPLADSTAIPIYFLSQMARESGNKVILTGDGSDEIFLGYRNWLKYVKVFPFYNLYTSFPKFFKKALASLYENFDDNSPANEIVQRAANEQEFFWGGAKSFKENSKKKLLHSKFYEKNNELNSHDKIAEFRKYFERVKQNKKPTDIDWMCYFGLKNIIPNLYLYRADRLAMANSVEIRCPFLDYQFVNFALSIPSNFKVKGGVPKYILKKSLEKILPAELLYRKKQGFCVPLKEWGEEIMLQEMESSIHLLSEDLPIFDKEQLQQQISGFKKNQKESINNLWTIYFLSCWVKKWIV